MRGLRKWWRDLTDAAGARRWAAVLEAEVRRLQRQQLKGQGFAPVGLGGAPRGASPVPSLGAGAADPVVAGLPGRIAAIARSGQLSASCTEDLYQAVRSLKGLEDQYCQATSTSARLSLRNDELSARLAQAEEQLAALRNNYENETKALRDQMAALQAEVAQARSLHPLFERIVAERVKQVGLGYDAARDDEQKAGEIARAAAVYAATHSAADTELLNRLWPLKWMQKNYRDWDERLVVAIAMLVAEHERLVRAGGPVLAEGNFDFAAAPLDPRPQGGEGTGKVHHRDTEGPAGLGWTRVR